MTQLAFDGMEPYRARLAKIMSVGPALASEDELSALRSDVIDALESGSLDFPEHDVLIREIREAWGSLV